MISSAQEFAELRERNDPRAAHDEASEAVWRDVLRWFPALKEWVVRNKTVPVEILCELATDSDPRVRYEVAAKRKCPASVLERLAHDADAAVRLRVAYNTKTPDYLLEQLRHDPDDSVAKVVEERLSHINTSG